MATHYPALSENMATTQGFENMFRVSTFSDNIVISGQLDPTGFAIVTTVCAILCKTPDARSVRTWGHYRWTAASYW